MKEAIVLAGPKVTIRDVDFPTLPSPNHLIIKVVVSGSNPKDWAIADRCKCARRVELRMQAYNNSPRTKPRR